MCEKGGKSQLLKSFIIKTKNQFEKSVKIVRSDNESELVSNPMQVFYQENGILHQSSLSIHPNKMKG